MILKIRTFPETASSATHAVIVPKYEYNLFEQFKKKRKIKVTIDEQVFNHQIYNPEDIINFYANMAFINDCLDTYIQRLQKIYDKDITIKIEEIDPWLLINHQAIVYLKGNPEVKGAFFADLAHWIIKNGLCIFYDMDYWFYDMMKQGKINLKHYVLNQILIDSDWNISLNGNVYVLWDYKWKFGQVRVCFDEKEEPEIPENIEVKITNKCKNNCPFCYTNSTPDGEHADIEPIIEYFYPSFGIRGLPYAVFGGGNPIEHPEIFELINEFVDKFDDKRVGMTLKDTDLVETNIKLDGIIARLFSIGISYSDKEALRKALENVFTINPKIYVGIHVINGIHNEENIKEIEEVIENVKVKNDIISHCAIIVLGFKQKGRAKDWKFKNTISLDRLFKSSIYNIGFDTLGYEQLKVKDYIFERNDSEWDAWREWIDLAYLGQDGEYSMYLDAVEWKIHPSSNHDESFVAENIVEDYKMIRKFIGKREIAEKIERIKNDE